MAETIFKILRRNKEESANEALWKLNGRPMNAQTKTFQYNSASLQLHEFGNGMASISHVFSKERGKGHATALMEQVVEYADQNDLILNLEVRRYGHPIGPDNSVLMKFYSKFGFVRVLPNSKEFIFMQRPLEESK